MLLDHSFGDQLEKVWRSPEAINQTRTKWSAHFQQLTQQRHRTKPEHFEERGRANRTMGDPRQFSAAITIARRAPTPTLKVRNTKTTLLGWSLDSLPGIKAVAPISLFLALPKKPPTPLINGLDHPFGKALRNHEINRNGRKYNSYRHNKPTSTIHG
mgnify:CR=1 FL=1